MRVVHALIAAFAINVVHFKAPKDHTLLDYKAAMSNKPTKCTVQGQLEKTAVA